MIKKRKKEEEARKDFEKLYYQIKNKILLKMKDKKLTIEMMAEQKGMSPIFLEEIMTTNYEDFSLYLDLLNEIESM